MTNPHSRRVSGRSWLWVLLCVGVSLWGASPAVAASSAEAPRVVPGEDWSFPPGTPDSINGGLRNLGFQFIDPHAPLMKSELVIVWWGNKMNPRPGVFDFSAVDQRLEAIHAAGKRSGLLVVNWLTSQVPDWVSIDRSHRMADVFAESYRQAYKQLIAALGKRYGHDPRVETVRMGLFTSGESLWLPEKDKVRYGLEPTGRQIEDYIQDIQTAYEAAFPFEKLVFPVGNVGNYFAWQWALRGGALRDGGIQGTWMKMYPWSRFYDPLQQKLIPAYPPHFLAPEYEEINTDKKVGLNYETFRFNCLWAAALHARYLCLNPRVLSEGKPQYEKLTFGHLKGRKVEPYFRPICLWLNKNLGTRIEDAPEVFCALAQSRPVLDPRHTYLRRAPEWPIVEWVHSAGRPSWLSPNDWRHYRRFCVNNVERFLYEGALFDGSAPCEPTTLVGRQARRAGPDGRIFVARRTDHANGKDYLCFDIDDRFLFDWQIPIEIRVTFLDRGHAAWRLEYDAGERRPRRTSPVVNADSGRIKTAIFALDDACFGNRLEGLIDFRLYNGGREDVTARLVRLVKRLRPSASKGVEEP